MILLDTNLLTRVTDSAHPHCAAARGALHTLLARGERVVIVPQNLYEFWVVATRSASVNGLGMTVPQATEWINFIRRRFELLPDLSELVERWLALVQEKGVKGFRAHDVRLVAAMKTHGVKQLLTFNVADFRGWGMDVIDPGSM